MNDKECHLLHFLTDCYNEFLGRHYVQKFKSYDVKYTLQDLLEKLQITYGNKTQSIIIKKISCS